MVGDGLQPSGPVVHLTTVHQRAESAAGSGASELEDLYRSQWAPMVRLAWLMGGNREEAEDVVHDAFLQLEPRWSSIENPPAYLRQTVVNGVRTRHRRKILERRHESYEGDVSNVLDDYEEIWASLEALPDRQRQALVLRFYLDLTIAEVADLLDCPIGTAKSLIHRGLAGIREKVQQ
jgi:RNA polymerase sigma factor (sigma-70 family)